MATVDSYREKTFSCPQCGWTGLGKDCVRRELFRDLFEIDCPGCGDKIELISLPLVSEILNTARRLGELDPSGTALFPYNSPSEGAGRFLYDPEQLPNIFEEFIVLTWDCDGQQPKANIFIKHGSRIIWREPCSDKGWERFKEIGEILKEKYGSRLKDLIPTTKAEIDFFGNSRALSSAFAQYRESFKK
ncbi:MAG TPA: hypothetical protein DD723_05310 [Candidatus Omnitrophica bacterium]|nr:MAG: hypothetical protein A2Z81_05745 [Omnitrophica WOR_2 bacterium GWA2_45_18]HBR14947.1 hypothetical protein [Candidatus Omnitrophota bacterium]